MNISGSVVLGAVAGILLTLGVGRAWPRPAPAPSPGPAAPVIAPMAAENARLRAECETLRLQAGKAAPEALDREAESLSRDIAELKRKLEGRKTREEKAAAARTLYEDYLGILRGTSDMKVLLKIQKAIKELEAEDVLFFAEKYRTAPTPVERSMSLYLALQCGGAPAAEFLKSWLADASVPVEERDAWYSQMAFSPKVESAESMGMPISREILIDEDLARTAYQLSRSLKTEERLGAAGLLAWHDTAESRQKLTALCASDSNLRVRAAAITSLARIGDASTLAYLEGLPLPEDPAIDWKHVTWEGPDDPRLGALTLRGALKGAISALKAKVGK